MTSSPVQNPVPSSPATSNAQEALKLPFHKVAAVASLAFASCAFFASIAVIVAVAFHVLPITMAVATYFLIGSSTLFVLTTAVNEYLFKDGGWPYFKNPTESPLSF